MSSREDDVLQYVRGLEASAAQLTTAIHWLSVSLVEESRGGCRMGLAVAAQLDGPVRALSLALINLNDGMAGLLDQAESELREETTSIH